MGFIWEFVELIKCIWKFSVLSQMEWFKDSVFRIRCVSGGKSGTRRFKFGACGIEGKLTKMPRGSAPRVNVVRDAVLAKRQTKRYPTYHADYAYQQALYSPQMSPQYYQYGQTSPLPGTPQPYNYPQIGFTTNPRAGLQDPQLGALSPYIQQTTALIDPSFITPVPSSLHSLQLQPPPNARAPVVPFSTLIHF